MNQPPDLARAAEAHAYGIRRHRHLKVVGSEISRGARDRDSIQKAAYLKVAQYDVRTADVVDGVISVNCRKVLQCHPCKTVVPSTGQIEEVEHPTIAGLYDVCRLDALTGKGNTILAILQRA